MALPNPLKLSDLKVGDRVSAWVFTGSHKGADRNALVYMTVIRVNRKTVTVRTDFGDVQRLDPYHLNDFIRPSEED